MPDRIYVVENRETGAQALVRATTRTGAVGIIASRQFSARVPKQDELVQLVRQGMPVLEAGEAQDGGGSDGDQ
jgi:hypothetical protein